MSQSSITRTMTTSRRKRTESVRLSDTPQIPINRKNVNSYADASSRLKVSNATALMASPPCISDSSHLCLVCDEECSCPPPSVIPEDHAPNATAASSSNVLSKYVKSLSNVDKDTIFEALKQMSPRVFKSITQTLKKKILTDSSSTSAKIPPTTSQYSNDEYASSVWGYSPQTHNISSMGDTLYIIDNNVSYDHQASFYNHLNYISANATNYTSEYSLDIDDFSQAHDEVNASKRSLNISPSDSTIVTSSPSTCFSLEDLFEIDLMFDSTSSQVYSEEVESVFSRFQPVQSMIKRRPSIPPLKKIPKVAAFRNPNADPYITGPTFSSQENTGSSSSTDIYYEKVTSWLSPSETTSLISVLKIDQHQNTKDDHAKQVVHHHLPLDTHCHQSADVACYKELEETPKNLVLSGLLKGLSSISAVSSDEDGYDDNSELSDEFVEIEFHEASTSDEKEYFGSDDDNDVQDEIDNGMDSVCIVSSSVLDSFFETINDTTHHLSFHQRQKEKLYHSNVIESSSYLIDYSHEFMSSDTSPSPIIIMEDDYDDGEEYGFSSCEYISTCDCDGICFCDAFIEIEVEEDEEAHSHYSNRTVNPHHCPSFTNAHTGDEVLVYDDLIAI